jgi:hypothetical protein
MNEVDFKPADELDYFASGVKSSVKLTKNSRGVNWEVRVVAGEEKLIDELMRTAIKAHKVIVKSLIEIKEDGK